MYVLTERWVNKLEVIKKWKALKFSCNEPAHWRRWLWLMSAVLSSIPSLAANVLSSFWHASSSLSSSSFCCVLTPCPYVWPPFVRSSVSSPAACLSSSTSLLCPASFSSLSSSPSASLLASLSALKPSSRASFRGWAFLLEAGCSASCSCSCSCSASASSRRRFLATGQPRMLMVC